MRMEQYLQCIDYTLWEIVENGNAPIVTKTVDGKETVIPPTSIEEKAQRGQSFQGSQTVLHISVLTYPSFQNALRPSKATPLIIPDHPPQTLTAYAYNQHSSFDDISPLWLFL
ncbi:hypothetical protein Tco_0271571 [Tanacetum coccineum]